MNILMELPFFRLRTFSAFVEFHFHKMNSTLNADHLMRTADHFRKQIITPATVIEIRKESETVKSLMLQIHDKQFSFKPGQWVDTFIPGLQTVGGFSICTSPGFLKSKGLLQLAVKFNKHPPAYWVHTQCKVGDKLHLRAGGDFYFDTKLEEEPSDVLLVAGGVGINPLLSMINHIVDINSGPDGLYKGKVILLYSAQTCSELIFKNQLQDVCSKNCNIFCKFFITKELAAPFPVKASRIHKEDICAACQEMNPEKLQVFLCGPYPMIVDVEAYCLSCSISKQQIYYEKWTS